MLERGLRDGRRIVEAQPCGDSRLRSSVRGERAQKRDELLKIEAEQRHPVIIVLRRGVDSVCARPRQKRGNNALHEYLEIDTHTLYLCIQGGNERGIER